MAQAGGLSAIRDVSDALLHLHALGYAHMDIHPRNIIVQIPWWFVGTTSASATTSIPGFAPPITKLTSRFVLNMILE